MAFFSPKPCILIKISNLSDFLAVEKSESLVLVGDQGIDSLDVVHLLLLVDLDSVQDLLSILLVLLQGKLVSLLTHWALGVRSGG